MSSKEALSIIRKTREDYNTIASHFSNTRPHIWPEFNYLKRFIKDGNTILDWGCGNGRLIFVCKEKKRVKYFGVDQSLGLLKIARKNFQKEIKEGWVKFFSNARSEKKFPNDFFDNVFLISSFFHLPDEPTRLALLKKIYRELKSGGRIILLVWNLSSDWAKQKSENNWKKIGENDFLIPWKNPEGKVMCERYYHHFGKDELKELLKKAGFKIKRLSYFNSGTWSDAKGGRNLVAVAQKFQS